MTSTALHRIAPWATALILVALWWLGMKLFHIESYVLPTPFEAVEQHLPNIDLLLVMTVHPGFGGQAFRPEMMGKVTRARGWRQTHQTTLHIEVDGGINTETAKLSVASGANVLVAGTSIFRMEDYAKAIRELRGSV